MHVLDEDKEILVEGNYGGRDVLQPKEQFLRGNCIFFEKLSSFKPKTRGIPSTSISIFDLRVK